MRSRLTAAALGLVLGGSGLALLDPPHSSAPGRVDADAALVMSGDVGYRRLGHAIDLFQGRAVSRIVLTGAGAGGDSAAAMSRIAMKRGVPQDRILIEDDATSTRENVLLSVPLLREHGLRRVALVTNASHMGRAERVARRTAPEVRWIPVPVEDPGPTSRIVRTRLQEWVKLAWYAVRGWI